MILEFKKFFEHYWGSAFTQEKDLVNGPEYREKGINSRYKGPGVKTLDTLDVDKMYGFNTVDKAKIDAKTMKKKMKK